MSGDPADVRTGLWMAMGAALGGVILGAVAVYMGLMGRPVDTLPPVLGAAATARAVAESPAGTDRDAVAPRPRLSTGLASAVASTRDAVVNLKTGRGLGAGVIVDSSGVVLTNYHVIADVLTMPPSRRIGGIHDELRGIPGVSAVFEDGRELPAVVLFSDPDEDVALLRLQPADTAERFEAAQLGRSGTLAVGEDVFAIGNPFGLTHTLSRGIVSALSRTDVLQNREVPLIQLDAAINVGNSGGPLFNLRGELVGIVTARVGEVQRVQAEGIAFALPIDHIRAFLKAVTQDGGARSGIVGVVVKPDIPFPKAAQDLGYTTGVVIDQVYEDYPAALAGLLPGDALVEMRGKRFDGLVVPAGASPALTLMQHIQKNVRALFPGEKLPVQVVRDGQLMTFEVEVRAANARDQAHIDMEELFGIVLATGGGVPRVQAVLSDSWLGGRRGVEQLVGMKVVQVLGRRVKTLEDLGLAVAEVRQLLRQSSAGGIRVGVWLEDAAGEPLWLMLPVSMA